MAPTYSRTGSLLIKKETTENTAVIPDVAIPINSEDFATDYGSIESTPVQGNRAMNLRALAKAIPAPVGSISVNIEPKTFPHFLNSLGGGVVSGVLFTLSDVDDLEVGDVLSNGSTGTGTITAILSDKLQVLCSGVSGDWATGNTVTSGSHSSTLGTFSASVYGHVISMPAEIDVSYTVHKNLADRAERYMGVKFHAIDSFAQSDNILTAGVKAMARSAFHSAKVLGSVSSGSGSKTILLDQTHGLVVGDSVKIFRPSTGAYLDFASSGVKTHTIGTVNADTSIVVTNLQTALVEGDILVLAPITPAYSVTDEFIWVGGSQLKLGASNSALSDIDVQEYSIMVSSEMEEKHAATGTNIKDRFPVATLQKGLTAEGSFTAYNESEKYRSLLRLQTAQAIELSTVGREIGSTDLFYTLQVQLPSVRLNAFDLPLSQDDIVNEEVPFVAYYDTTAAFLARIVVINDVASY